MKGAYAFLDCLREAGISHIFGNVGTTEVPILDALVDYPDISFITVLHESIAVGMAEGYARTSGLPGVAMVHTAAGTSNTIGALMNAYKQNAPVLLVAGEKDIRMQGRGHFIEAPDLVGMARQFCKAAWKISSREKLPEAVARALRTCMTEPQGPVFLALTADALRTDFDDQPAWVGTQSHVGKLIPSDDDIFAAADLLANAQAPVIIAGSKTARAGATQALVEIAEILGSAVILEDDLVISDTPFPNNHRLLIGQMDPAGELPRESKAMKALLASSDVVLGAGCLMFMEFAGSNTPYIPLTAKLIHIYPQPLELERLYEADVAMAGDTGAALTRLRDALKQRAGAGGIKVPASYHARVKEARQELEDWKEAKEKEDPDASPMRIWQAVRVLSEVAPDNALIVEESIRSAPYLFIHYDFSGDRRYLGSNGGCLGWGLPAALGAKMASPDRPVIAFLGNGSALYPIQGLWTAGNTGTPLVTVIINNKAYMAVKSALGGYRGRAVTECSYKGCELSSPDIDFVQLANGFGVKAVRANTAAEFKNALRDCLALDCPSLIEIMVEPNDYLEVGRAE